VNGAPCPDARVCNGAETCQAGTCTAGTPLVCNDGNPCTTDTCDPVLGCQSTPVIDGSSCADNTVCNGNETCLAGVCQPGVPLVCDDLNPCTTDTCDAVLACLHAPVPDGTCCGVLTSCLNGAGV